MLSTSDFNYALIIGRLSGKFRGLHSDVSVVGYVLEHIAVHFHSEPLEPHLCWCELEFGVQGVSRPHGS